MGEKMLTIKDADPATGPEPHLTFAISCNRHYAIVNQSVFYSVGRLFAVKETDKAIVRPQPNTCLTVCNHRINFLYSRCLF